MCVCLMWDLIKLFLSWLFMAPFSVFLNFHHCFSFSSTLCLYSGIYYTCKLNVYWIDVFLSLTGVHSDATGVVHIDSILWSLCNDTSTAGDIEPRDNSRIFECWRWSSTLEVCRPGVVVNVPFGSAYLCRWLIWFSSTFLSLFLGG